MSIGYEAKIAPELRVFGTSIDNVQPHPLNARIHRLDKLMASLTKHGQYALIIAQKSTGYIVKGNGTWTAAKQLGWTQVAINVQDMSDQQALAMLVDDNTTSDLARNNKAKTLAILKQLTDTIWSEDEIADLDEELAPLAELSPTSEAAYTHEGSEHAQEVQDKREAKAKTEQERLKDVRFPLTLADHAVFMDRLKTLQKRFGTPGAIATIMETVRRQADAEAAMPVTGRNMDEATRDGIKWSVLTDLKALLGAVPQDPMPRQYVMDIVDRAMPQLAPKPAPAEDAPLPGQLPAFPDLTDAAAEVFADVMSEPEPNPYQQASLVPPKLAETAGEADQPNEPEGLAEGQDALGL